MSRAAHQRPGRRSGRLRSEYIPVHSGFPETVPIFAVAGQHQFKGQGFPVLDLGPVGELETLRFFLGPVVYGDEAVPDHAGSAFVDLRDQKGIAGTVALGRFSDYVGYPIMYGNL
jgi:hypothetical protein